jgi:hypothetical protein
MRAVAILAGAIASLALLGLPSRAHAFAHVVLPGETLAQIATRVYGDAKYEYVLVGANSLDAQGGSAIAPGMRIEIPAPGHHRVVGKETWYELALAYLGDPRRADVLAGANRAVAWVPPVEGQEIIIPPVLSHIGAEGDSDMMLAQRYLGDINKAWVLDAYNFRKPGPLHRGEVMLIALPDLGLTVRGRAEARDAQDRGRTEGGGGVHDAQRRAEAELPALLADVHGGRYVDAVARGNRLLGSGELTRPQLALIHHALLESYVALEATGAAAGACAAWRASDASVHLDPVLVSPKIRAACTPQSSTATPASSGATAGAPR